MLMNSQFWMIATFVKKWQKSRTKSCIFWGERGREFEKDMRGQVGATFSSTNSSNQMGSFKKFTGTGIITQCTTGRKVKIQTIPASK